MMRTRVVFPFLVAFASTMPAAVAGAQGATVTVRPLYDPQVQQPAGGQFTAQQLDNLVGPIALYPDALLAQVLVAATFPDQIDAAAQYVRANGTNGIDDQNWDVSVKAVAHYPTTLNMMTSKPDWTTALGQAYAMQSSDVMASVQHLRSMAHDQGNLVSTAQQNVVVDNGNYVIVPAQPQVIYVPVYDPVVIYTRPVFYARGFGGYWSFGVGFPIGGWLSYDCDWRGRRVYYQGWDNRGYGYDWWRARSRPYVRITNVYVNPRYANVYVNRGVEHRSVNYGALDHYNGVHRDVHYAPAMGNDRDHGRDRATPPGRPSSGFDYRTTIPTTVQPRVNGSYDDRNAPRGGQGRDGQSRGGSPDGGQRGGQGRPQQPQPQPQAPRDQPRMQPEAPRHEQQPVQQQARPQIKAPQPKHDEKRPEGHDGRRDGEQSQFRRG